MSGDAHVRIRERLGVQFPRATRLVVGFQQEGDARRFLDAMRDRLGEFQLSLHLDKTRLIEFGRFAATNRKLRGIGKPETFAFLEPVSKGYCTRDGCMIHGIICN